MHVATLPISEIAPGSEVSPERAAEAIQLAKRFVARMTALIEHH
jgi:hypothetical protein